jgi:dTDP-4-amino-4,6-dideoxygalactose transaminase
VEERITLRTKAVIVVDIFGLPYDADRINAIAKKHGLKVIEDAAQAPGVRYKGKYAGTLGDIGVYSLNYHKHIHSGEGGVIVTDDDELARRMRLIRNHAEAVVEDVPKSDLVNMLGFNYRMTEIEAAIARRQLKKLKGIMNKWRGNVAYLEERLANIPCLEMPSVRPDCGHAYYMHPIKFRTDAGIKRERFVEAVGAELAPYVNREDEGVKIGCGYVRPLYFQPLYRRKIVYGSGGFPFNYPPCKDTADYSEGICPVCEEMHFRRLITHELMRPSLSREDLDDVADAFFKVWECREEL